MVTKSVIMKAVIVNVSRSIGCDRLGNFTVPVDLENYSFSEMLAHRVTYSHIPLLRGVIAAPAEALAIGNLSGAPHG